jgi:hypothetical protein
MPEPIIWPARLVPAVAYLVFEFYQDCDTELVGVFFDVEQANKAAEKKAQQHAAGGPIGYHVNENTYCLTLSLLGSDVSSVFVDRREEGTWEGRHG